MLDLATWLRHSVNVNLALNIWITGSEQMLHAHNLSLLDKSQISKTLSRKHSDERKLNISKALK